MPIYPVPTREWILGATMRELGAWGDHGLPLMAMCACPWEHGRHVLPKLLHPDLTTRELVVRLRCRACGERPRRVYAPSRRDALGFGGPELDWIVEIYP